MTASEQELIVRTFDRIFRDVAETRSHAAERAGQWAELWSTLEGLGATRIGIAESDGGSGGGIQASVALVRLAAYHAVPLPLAETACLASWLLARAGLPGPGGPLTAAPARLGDVLTASRVHGEWHLDGTCVEVPWARAAAVIVVVARSGDGTLIASVDADRLLSGSAENLAGEPRDTLRFDSVTVDDSRCRIVPGLDVDDLLMRGALVRAAQITGAMQRAGDLAIRYAQERVQFGRPIRTFQAVQQHLVTIAGELASASALVDLACRVVDAGEPSDDAIAAAKVRASEAVSPAAAAAHQVLGAMGVTDEHPLQLATRRLWSWRDEYGSESYWSVRLGRSLMAEPSPSLWALIADCD